jgi:DNA-binding HxlR family transcriptional regulator
MTMPSWLQKATMELPKETILPQARHGRWYDDACGSAFAMELVGERWSLLIVRELMFGGRRFSDIRAALPGISAKVLSERLDGMEAAGIVRRSAHEQAPGIRLYELTEWGLRADVAIIELGRWAAMSPRHDPTLPLSAASLMLSFRTMFDAALAGDMRLTGQIDVGAERFIATVERGSLGIVRGRSAQADFGMAAPVGSLIAGAIYLKLPFADLPGLTVESPARAEAFRGLFHLPAKIG